MYLVNSKKLEFVARKAIVLLFLFSFNNLIKGQNEVNISKPELSFADNKLIIRYDITGCGRGENVNIRLIVLDSKGDTLRPVFIEGDLGKMVACGLGKSIVWDIAKDKIKLDDELSVQIRGEKFTQPATQIIYSGKNALTRGNVLLSSVFVPGLGQKKASGKSAYFIFSGLVYGGIGATVYFNIKSSGLKEDYNNASGAERDNLYNDWQNAYDMTVYSAIGTAGIWAINMIWSAVIPIREKEQKKVSFYMIPDSRNTFLLGARICF
jgi:hypothetical protein